MFGGRGGEGGGGGEGGRGGQHDCLWLLLCNMQIWRRRAWEIMSSGG